MDTTQAQAKVIELVSQHCNKFLSNIGKYNFDGNGVYPWAWDGERIVVRIDVGTYRLLDKLMDGQGEEEGAKIVFETTKEVKGKKVTKKALIGQAKIYKPYAYPQLFLYLYLEKPYAFNPQVVLKFAKMAGFNKEFDLQRITIHQETEEERQERINSFEL